MNTEKLNALGEHVKSALSAAVLNVEIIRHELIITIDRTSVIAALTFLRDDAACRFVQLVDVCGVDYPAKAERLCVVYNLLSLVHNQRIRVKVWTDENTPVASVVEVFPAAGWFEREVWDMYGVYFDGHPDLRRILTDYGFDGHPLRKDFPLTGYVEVRYDPEQQRVIYEPVKLTQSFRKFDFLSPWEGAADLIYNLPGDEKATKESGIANRESGNG
ncbi:MAG: NADH-quinone oxidoreductase subunit C [Rickettsiales bacterium]|nr:NADH-quinone oxidoreductase subunit C [Rickettsiales bacterium]